MNVDGQTDGRRDVWENPLASRYASAEMATLWSAEHKVRLERHLWLAVLQSPFG